ncbi:MAG: type I secretion system permease/ATPase [Methyloligellaceae bacterium]
MKSGRRRKNSSDRASPAAVLVGIKSTTIFIFLLSGVVNVLALTGALYMLQIYDRTLTSQSIPTLLALSVLAIGLYMCQGMLDVTRSQILVRLGAKFDKKLAPLAHRVTIDMPRYGFSAAESKERGRDVDTIRQFMSGQGPQALFDLPWMPMYIAFVYFLHPWLGMLAIFGALLLATLTLITEILTRQKSQTTQRAEVVRANMADAHTRNSDVLRAMGFAGRAIERFEKANSEHLELQTKTNDVTGTLGGISKVLRMMLQSAVLGLGAYFTIQGDLTAGAIIAASVATARALAPVDLAISQWKGLVAARRSYRRLAETLTSIDDDERLVELPPPERSLDVEKVTVAAPGSGAVVLSDVSLELEAGQALGLIGPSGGGKSTFARAITGIWPLVRGHVRLDGADVDQWRPDDLGNYVGYVPQDVSLLDGTVAENICRLEQEPDSDKILAAARAAGVHELIVRLPDGYQSELGPNGMSISAGQRQRIALARALYNEPFLVVLDEPNSNLDFEGDQALTAAIEGIKARNGIAIVIAHRPSAIVACDFIGVIKQGRLVALGPKDEIIDDHTNTQQRPSPVPQPVRAVGQSAGA